jgi:hypothetical protein
MRSLVPGHNVKKGRYPFSAFLPAKRRVVPFSMLLSIVLAGAAPARAQDPPPRIPWFAVDLHGSVPRFPSEDQELATSRGMNLADLPGRGLGVQVGAHLYPLRWHGITFGIGGELAVSRARKTPPTAGAQPLLFSEERYTSIAPQLSFNFGHGNGWSYLSGGLGQSTWSLVPAGKVSSLSDSERLKTINYGGGARWFIKPHVAFSFDVRLYAINPGSPLVGPGGVVRPGSPRTTLMIIGAGVSMK